MKKRFQSYLAFLPNAYRIVMFLVVPALIVAIPLLLQQGIFFTVSSLTLMVLATAEIIMDFWAFGGMAMKNGLQLEYLKTSRRGMAIVLGALCAGLLRIILQAVLMLIATGLIFGGGNGFSFLSGGKIRSYLCLLLAEYVCVVLAQLICRFFDGLGIHLLLAYLMNVLLLCLCFVAKYYDTVALPVLFLTAIVLSIMSVKIILWRVQGSYYDKMD